MRTTSRLSITLFFILSMALAAMPGMKPAPVGAAAIVVNTVVDENDGSCVDGDCSLRDAIAVAVPGDTINFDFALGGQTITLSLGALQVGTSLTIDGSTPAGHVKISGNDAFRVFITQSPGGVTLRGLDIVNGNTTTGNGGGILNTGTATVEDSVVSNNRASYGGGIRNEGDLTVRGSTISDNTADFGGGIDNYVGNLTMTNTTVERNTAVHYGGGITTGANALIEDSIFSENTAEAGGGIESHETGVTLTLTRCTFTGNTAHLPAGYGAALHNNLTAVEVNESTFQSNSADAAGGGAYNLSAGAMVVNDSTFTGNTAESDGGAVGNHGTLELNRSTFTDNTADNAGGGVYNGSDGVMVVNDSTFTGNMASSATDGYGGAVENNGTLELNRSTFADNTAFINGGAIENWEGDLTVAGCSFTGNSAAAGGAVNNNAAGTLIMTDSTLRANSAEVGGGLFNDNSSTVQVSGSTFAANNATADNGGGIENRGNSTLTVGNSTFSANSTVSNGGGINNHHGVLTLTNVTLAENSAGGGGGLSIGTAGTLKYRNTVVAYSSGGDCNNAGTIAENVNNLVEDGDCDSWLSGDPWLDALGDNGGPTETHALLPGSPAIDEGDNATCPPTDQRGYRRPEAVGSDCDMGAFEYNSSPLAVLLASFAAQPLDDHIVISWETVSEIDTVGFNLYRDLAPSGPNRLLLGYAPAQAPGSPQGAVYRWSDEEVAAGQTYWYWLEPIDLAGQATLHGPVSATMPSPTAVVWTDFQAAPVRRAAPAPWALAATLAGLGVVAISLSMHRRARAARGALRCAEPG